MKSPWEILQKSVGSGGVIGLLSSNNFLDNLSELGIEYIEVQYSTYNKLLQFWFHTAKCRLEMCPLISFPEMCVLAT